MNENDIVKMIKFACGDIGFAILALAKSYRSGKLGTKHAITCCNDTMLRSQNIILGRCSIALRR